MNYLLHIYSISKLEIQQLMKRTIYLILLNRIVLSDKPRSLAFKHPQYMYIDRQEFELQIHRKFMSMIGNNRINFRNCQYNIPNLFGFEMFEELKKQRTLGFISNSPGNGGPAPNQNSNKEQQSSDGFSSFRGSDFSDEYDSDREFSPYKYQSGSRNKKVGVTSQPQLSKLPAASMFKNEKLRENYLRDSPDSGKIVDTREKQIRQNLKKRAQISKELEELRLSNIRNSNTKQQIGRPAGNRSRVLSNNIKNPYLQKNVNIAKIQNKYNFPSGIQDKDLNQNKVTFGLTNRGPSKDRITYEQHSLQESSVEREEEDSSPNFFNSFSKGSKSTGQYPALPTSSHQYSNIGVAVKKQENGEKQSKVKHNKYIFSNYQDYSSSSQQQQQQRKSGLITQYSLSHFKDLQKRQQILENPQRQLLFNQNKMYKTKGGVCFELDTNQFTQPDLKKYAKPQTHILKEKNRQINSKEEILKRRKMAKAYDKDARAKLFGY